jgi:two-component system, chemotaxis family, protein-glutamate methylesterase/glutaminase
MTVKPITVIVIDDSALMRQMITELLNGAGDIKVVASAPDPIIARELIKQHNPDVITLDVEMPKMDGLSFLEKIMTLRPMPVVMVSSLTAQGAEATLRALELGAIDYVTKPHTDLQKGMQALADDLRTKVRTAAKAKVCAITLQPRQTYDKKIPAVAGIASSEKIIALGASTGGVEAVTEILANMPPDAPAIIITLHMPEKFTASFAARLNNITPLAVAEAQHGARLLPGHAYIAPGGFHMELDKSGANYVCKIHQDASVSGHRPSIDVLFHSVSKTAGKNAIGVILTGMGRDGADGLLAMRQTGAKTIGQDETSSIVYGMPKAAFELGAVEKQFPLKEISKAIMEQLNASGRILRI